MAPDRPFSPPGDDRPSRSPWRGFKITLIALVTIVLLGVVIVVVWAAMRYQQGVELARKAREQYTAINTQFPFQTPRPGQAAGPRWSALLAARAQVQRAAAPELRLLLTLLLDARSLTSPELYRQLMAGIPLLDRMLTEQLAALRREQMSAREYQWLLGLAILAGLESPAVYPAGKVYQDVLARLERLTRADGDPGNNVDARAVCDYFRKFYQDAARPGPEVMGQFPCPDEAAGGLDLLMAAAQWAQGDTVAEGALKGLAPKR